MMITYPKNQENNYIWVQGAKKGQEIECLQVIGSFYKLT